MIRLANLVGGELVPPVGGEYLDNIDPAIGQVYSLTPDQLLWAGLSESFNPTEVEQSIGEIARAVSRELRREGLIAN